MQRQRSAELRRGLGDMHARAAVDLFELENGCAVVVPVEDETLTRLGFAHDGAALLAVSPAEDALSARLRVELDLGREPLLEPVRLGQGLPDLVGRGGYDDLTLDLHGRLLSLDTQPSGCTMMRNQ